ncbi:type IV pilus biogenesis protein PilP [Salipiger mucosus]|uniref:Type IV pilus biogenesis protein PilP n=1 Tax=Salipiger mucosus DSM 16094 TaxID=1123237 RepID=S9QK99_9RHOB|nr:type IV pilus biogenesis protein PilP [Salipiger mucosus]EPX81891.1 hypothetical protein Salmuc_00205 [Salipiger mucosus DSM 16094]
MLDTSLRPRPRPEDLDTTYRTPFVSSKGEAQSKATTRARMNPRDLIVLGVFGASDDMRALLRLPNGRVTQVGRGDRVGGRQVVAIGEDGVVVSRSGRTERLEIPS